MHTGDTGNTAKQKGEYIAAFLFGFFAYGLFETALRGYTHWTMVLLGGAAAVLLYGMEMHPAAGALCGAVFVTAAEFAVGVLDNLIMGWQVWDYSDMPLNLMGQICPMFSALWYVLCFLGILICRRIRRCYLLPERLSE